MDPEAFVAMYRAEAEGVLLFLTRRTFDAEVAVELTAETFAEAWRGRRGLRRREPEAVRAWLLVIARRRWARWLERGRVEREAVQRLGMQLPAFHRDDLDEVERRAGLDGLRAELAPALAGLPGDQRRAVELRVVQELAYPDVAQALAVTEATARARVSRGLRALAKALDGHAHLLTTDLETGR